MIHPTVTQRSRHAVQAATRSPDVAFPVTLLAVALGVITGIGMAGVVIPAIMQVVVPAIVRVVTGA